MKTEIIIDFENMRELNPEELEDVTGGGIREIVAATTLAAMAMTGNTVSAFGLANALAEDTAVHIKEALRRGLHAGEQGAAEQAPHRLRLRRR